MDKVYVLSFVEIIDVLDWDEVVSTEIYMVYRNKEDAEKEVSRLLDVLEDFLKGHPHYGNVSFVRHDTCLWAEDNSLMYAVHIDERPLK